MPWTYRRKTDRGSWSVSALNEAVDSIGLGQKTIGEAANHFQILKISLHWHLRRDIVQY